MKRGGLPRGLFDGARRVGDGFNPLGPGEFPAVLHGKEAVIPLRGGAVPVRLIGERRGRGGPWIVINNPQFGGGDTGPDRGRPALQHAVEDLVDACGMSDDGEGHEFESTHRLLEFPEPILNSGCSDVG